MKLNRSEIARVWPIAKRRVGNAIISFVQRLFSGEKFVKDIFGRKREKRALLCHLPEAFASENPSKHHSNLTEGWVIARCFDRLGYSVDCTSRAKTGLNYAPYDVVFGINGNAFMGSFSADTKINPLRVFYSVGAESCFNYRVTSMRNADFHSRHGCWLLGSNRYMPGDPRNYYEAHFSDAVICLGDEFVYNQFLAEETRSERYRWLPAFCFKVTDGFAEKNFAECRRHILWFGSTGLLHKGLDIAFDFALAHPEFTLHVCGSSSRERDFWNYYNPKIRGKENIIMHGFVNIESREFADILAQCGLLLNPSISEGGAVAVLNVLGNGALLPVYSRATGIDLENVGIVVENVCYSDFEEAVMRADTLPLEEFERLAVGAYNRISNGYTVEQYEENMYTIIKDIIEKTKKI